MRGSNNKYAHNDLCVGIDLGTTNSVLSTINIKPNGDIVSKVIDIPRPVDIYTNVSSEAKLTTKRSPTLPSCIYYREEKNYEPLVGDFAKIQYPLRPHLVAKSIKSQMGNSLAENLSPDIPDKTPASIASRILKHMIRNASDICRSDITDAVITVPANFDSTMCRATRDAAEMAGICIRNSDGTERPVLLSEPNAVIYDLINQIRNGEISHHILDLSEKRNVMVFDLGGGTLDITMHEIKRRDNVNDEILTVNEIATNRYTLLGGDDFDREIAENMYQRYLKQYSSHRDVVSKLKKNSDVIMAQLINYAENLKIEINDKFNGGYSSGWDDDYDETIFNVGGNMGGIGYSYDDSYTREDVEEILSTFMADNLHYDDYKRINRITYTRNIIYPILDVLSKASEKLGTDDVKVDAVIVNGGMSKFYMIKDRLEDFFGFEPIVALDPDLSVARGAAVYHYYLHKYKEIQDNMKLIGDVEDKETVYNTPTRKPTVKDISVKKNKKTASYMPIEWGKSILNDSLYLGMRNGAVCEIIPTGAELPYKSQVMTGFKLDSDQNVMAIPIKSLNIDGSYRTIANGNITFSKKYSQGAYVAFVINMASNKVITMTAWTSSDVEGKKKIDEGYAEISIDSIVKPGSSKTKVVAPSGATLDAVSEINNLCQLYNSYERCKNKANRSNISKKIGACVNNICSAGNKDEFAKPILDVFNKSNIPDELKQRLFTISRKIGTGWTDDELNKLSNICMNQINAELHGMAMGGPRVNANAQAIYALSICGSEKQLSTLEKLHINNKYLQPCLYTHAKTNTCIDWLIDEFTKDIKQKEAGVGSGSLQSSIFAIGIALKRYGVSVTDVKTENRIVNMLCKLIKTPGSTDNEITCSVIALGCICDQRVEKSRLPISTVNEVINCIKDANSYNKYFSNTRAQNVAIKMIHGEVLSDEDEKFLLTKLEPK